MWNLSDVSECFKYKNKEGNIVNIGSLDYNKIVDFLNQDDFNYKNVEEYDYICVRELYFYGAQGVTTTVDNDQNNNILLIIFNNSFKTYNNWVLKHEIGHCNTGYEFKNGLWYRKDIGDQDEREKQANLFMLRYCWDENFINNYIEDAKRYFENISKILSKEVNKENLKKFFEKEEAPEEYLKWNNKIVSRGVYKSLLKNLYNLTTFHDIPTEIENDIKEKLEDIVSTFGK